MEKENKTGLIERYFAGKHANIALPTLISIVAILVFSTVFKSDILTYDDQLFVTHNEYVHGLSAKNIASIISLQSAAATGHYQPAVNIIYATIYEIDGLNPLLFHLVNIILHILNIFLIFKLILILARGKRNIAFIVSLLFAVHPMHVEPVCWVSGLNGVQYSTFFLFSLLYYCKYITEMKIKYLWITALFFILSLTSKSMAVTLSPTLLLFDWFLGRKINWKVLAEKIPFFLISFVFGLIAINSSKLLGTFGTMAYMDYSLTHRFFMINYSFSFYLLKAIIPFDLSVTIYNPILIDNKLPLVYYLSPLFLVSFVTSLFFIPRGIRKEIYFGLIFFVFTISVAVQFVPIGNVLGAERYTYLPNIGVLFGLATLFVYLTNKENKRFLSIRPYVVIALVAMVVYNTVTTRNRSLIWKSTHNLFNEMIEKNPSMAVHGYRGRSGIHKNNGDFHKALDDLNSAIAIMPTLKVLFKYRGDIKTQLGDYEGAIHDLNIFLLSEPTDFESYFFRGFCYKEIGQYQKAADDFSMQIKYDPEYFNGYLERADAFVHLKKFPEAVADIYKVLELQPENARAAFLLGQVKSNYPDYSTEEVITHYTQAIKLGLDTFYVYYNIGNEYAKNGNIENAEINLKISVQKNPSFIEGWNNLGILYFYQDDYVEAEKCFRKALEVAPDFADAMNNLGNVYLFTEQKEKACKAWNDAINLGYEKAQSNIEKHCVE